MQALYDVHSTRCGDMEYARKPLLLDRMGRRRLHGIGPPASFYYSREERRFYSRGAFREQQGRDGTRWWGFGDDLRDSRCMCALASKAVFYGRTRDGQMRGNDEMAEGCGGARAAGDVPRHASPPRTAVTSAVCIEDFWLRQQGAFVLSAWRCTMRTGQTTRAQGECPPCRCATPSRAWSRVV